MEVVRHVEFPVFEPVAALQPVGRNFMVVRQGVVDSGVLYRPVVEIVPLGVDELIEVCVGDDNVKMVFCV